MQNQEISLNNGSVVGGANASNFSFVSASANAKSVLNKYKLSTAGSRDDFVKNLNSAIDGLSE